MQLKQIAVTRVGRADDNSAYGIVIFALTEEGQLYAGKTHAGNLSNIEWKQVEHPKNQ